MNFSEIKLDVGIEKSFSFLHISDTHLTLADNRDDDRKIRLSESRSKTFPNAFSNLTDAEKFAKNKGVFIAHTGDLIDFVSEKNLEEAKKFTDENDVFFSAGNHEFSLYVGEAKEDENYRNLSLEKVQKVFKNDIRFSVRKTGGAKLIAIDNSYYRFDKKQLENLKKECDENLPVILFLHTPLFNKETYDFSLKNEGENSPAYLMSVPEELMKKYSPERYEQQKEDETTAKAYSFIMNCSVIKGIFAGHIHHDFETMLRPDLPQIVTGLSSGRLVTLL